MARTIPPKNLKFASQATARPTEQFGIGLLVDFNDPNYLNQLNETKYSKGIEGAVAIDGITGIVTDGNENFLKMRVDAAITDYLRSNIIDYWDSTVKYNLNSYAYNPITEVIYRSLIQDNIGNQLTDITKWGNTGQTLGSYIPAITAKLDKLSPTLIKQNTTNEGGQINFESPDGLGVGYIDVNKDTINNRYKHRFVSNFNGSNQEAFGIEYNSSGLLRQIYTALGKNLSTNGYITLTDGLILQWGTSGAIASGGSVTITLPITFPNQFLHVYATVVGGGANTVVAYYVLSEVTSLSTTTLRNTSPNGLVARWFAIGF